MENNQNIEQEKNIGDKEDQSSKTIEQASISNEDTNKPKTFMTKKRLVLTIIFLFFSIGFMFITIFPILKINWSLYNKSIGIGLGQNWGFLWLLLILINSFINLNRCFITLLPRINKLGCKISYKDYFVFALVLTFLYSVTPGGLVADPYTMFWLKTYGLTTQKATSVIFSNSLLWQLTQIIINLPFIIICSVFNEPLLVSIDGKVIFILIWVGFAIDVIGTVVLLALNMSKNFHYICSRIFNWFKMKFHMKYHTKEETKEKYKKRAVLKQDFIASIKDWKSTLLIISLFIAGEFLGLLAMIWAMNFVQYGIIASTSRAITFAKIDFNWGWVLVCARLSVPANKINFLPGQAMGYEVVLLKLLSVYSDLKVPVYVPLEQVESMKQTMVSNAVLTGKLFNGWLPALIGIGCFVSLTVKQNRLAKEGKLIQQKY